MQETRSPRQLPQGSPRSAPRGGKREQNAASVDHLLVESACHGGQVETVVVGNLRSAALKVRVKPNGERRCCHSLLQSSGRTYNYNPSHIQQYIHIISRLRKRCRLIRKPERPEQQPSGGWGDRPERRSLPNRRPPPMKELVTNAHMHKSCLLLCLLRSYIHIQLPPACLALLTRSLKTRADPHDAPRIIVALMNPLFGTRSQPNEAPSSST